MFSQYFIDKPRFAGVIAIVMILLGLLAIVVLPVSQYPQIVPPQIVVSTQYPGANAAVLIDTVAIPIENEINGVEDMLYMSSTSDDNGSYSLTITFNIGTDPDIAQVKVENRLQQVTSELPPLVVQEGLTVKVQSDNILAMLVLRSPNKTYDDLFLSNFAYTELKNPLYRVAGVGEVQIYGPQYSMRVWLNSEKLSSLGLNSDDVVKIVESQNMQASIGSVGAAPSAKDTPMVLALAAKGLLNSVEEFEKIVVATSANGGIVRLKDVSRIELGADTYTMNAKFDNTPAVVIGLSQTPNSNSLDIMDNVRKEMSELKKTFPQDIEFEVAYDSTQFVRASIKSIIETLAITFALVVLVTYIFLQKIKTTFIPLITIPVSLIATFAVIYLLGFDINILTLFAMILAIGLVVDDAIIVVERVEYLMHYENMDSKSASIKAMQQISGAIIATTFVLLAIFIPVALMAGITGKIYQQFAVTIATAVVFSAINALTLSPALCSVFLEGEEAGTPKGFFKWFNDVVEYFKQKYVALVGYFTLKLKLTSLIILAVMGVVAWGFSQTPTSFIPEEDQGIIFANVQLVDTATINQTGEVLGEVGDKILKNKAVEYFISVSGFSILGGGGENIAFGVVGLKPWGERKGKKLSAEDVTSELNKEFAKGYEAEINFFSPPAIPGIGSSNGLSFELLSKNASSTPNELFQALGTLLMKLNTSPNMAYAFSTFTADTPHLFLDVDRTKLESYQISLASLFSTLQNNLGSRYINNITLNGQVNKVILQADFEYRKNIKDVENLYVRSNNGSMIKVKSFATVSTTISPKIIYRYNQYTSAGVTAQSAPNVSTGTAIESILETTHKFLPSDYSVSWTGLSLQEVEAAGLAILLIGLAIIFCYLFLVALYESWLVAFSVIFSTIFAILGALIGLYVMGQPLSIYAQLGLIMLIGLSAKNAILIVEFMLDYRRQGESIVSASQKGAGERFRAVLMTAFTFILGVFPMVIATGAGASSQVAIGTAVFFGMIAATCVGIIFIPPLFAIFESIKEWSEKKKQRPKNYKSLILLGVFLLASCSVGPDYTRTEFYNDADLSRSLGLEKNADNKVTKDWYKKFDDKKLNQLVTKALTDNITSKVAVEKLRQARQSLKINEVKYFPTLDIDGSYHQNQVSKNIGASFDNDYYQAGIDASWEIDIWGGGRRLSEGYAALLKAATANVGNVRLSITAEVVNTYISLRTTQEQLRIAEKNLKLSQKIFQTVKEKYKAGLADTLEYSQAKYMLENAKMQIPDIKYQQEAYKNAMAILLGELPNKIDLSVGRGGNLVSKKPSLKLAELYTLPVSVVRNRPDVRISEQMLISKNANIGYAMSELYPNISISGFLGYQAKNFSNLISSGSSVYSLSPAISMPMLHWGAIVNNVKLQKYVAKEYLYDYQQSLQNAASEIKNSIEGLAQEQAKNTYSHKALKAQEAVFSLSLQKYESGLINFAELLQAEQNLLEMQNIMLHSNGAIYQKISSFYKAVGGGY